MSTAALPLHHDEAHRSSPRACSDEAGTVQLKGTIPPLDKGQGLLVVTVQHAARQRRGQVPRPPLATGARGSGLGARSSGLGAVGWARGWLGAQAEARARVALLLPDDRIRQFLVALAGARLPKPERRLCCASVSRIPSPVPNPVVTVPTLPSGPRRTPRGRPWRSTGSRAGGGPSTGTSANRRGRRREAVAAVRDDAAQLGVDAEQHLELVAVLAEAEAAGSPRAPRRPATRRGWRCRRRRRPTSSARRAWT